MVLGGACSPCVEKLNGLGVGFASLRNPPKGIGKSILLHRFVYRCLKLGSHGLVCNVVAISKMLARLVLAL